MAAGYKVLAFRYSPYCGFESRRGHKYLSLVSDVCYQVDVSAIGSLHVLRGHTDCNVSN